MAYQTMMNLAQEGDGKEVRLKANELIYRQGDVFKGLYLLCEGLVMSYRAPSPQATVGIYFHPLNSIIGVNSFQNEQYQYTAKALTDVKLLFFDKTMVQTYLQLSPGLKILLLQELCKKINQVESLWDKLQHKKPEQKVALLLQQIFSIVQKHGHPYKVCSLPLQEFALVLAISQKSLEKILQSFVHQEFIQLHGQQIILLHEESLQALQ
ncbi:MAG TPA: hypothetical protein DCM08_03845 [Microscillaceae bacterium]|jgi:CRP/FNR family transcriptional regulator|nr:hypothetical protein [Microscillaceae bacterium]